MARWSLGVLAKPQSAGVTFRQALVNGELGILEKLTGLRPQGG
ncbi:hypothetical protein ACF07Y_18135 [Streptomyces sp. NPDC016566]